MRITKIKLRATLAATALLSFSHSAFAVCDGCVVSAITEAQLTIQTAIASLGTSLSTILNEIDTDIASVGSKMSDSVVQAANAQREMALEVQRQNEIDQVMRDTELPIDPCATSSRNYALQAVRDAASKSSLLRPGGSHVGNPVLDKALNSPAPSVEASRRASASIHNDNYCSKVSRNSVA